jgi:hypothetical protein
MKTKILAAVALSAALSSPLYAQDPTAVCLAIVTSATHDVGIQSGSSSFLNTVYSNYCQQDGTTQSSSFNAGLSAVIYSIPIGLTGGGTDASTQITNFCKNYQSAYASSSQSFDMQSIVVQKALESANQCLKIATRSQNTISYSVLTSQMLAIKFGIPTGQTLDIHGISHDTSVSCEGSKVTGSGTIDFSTGSGQTITATTGTYNVSCTRKPFASQGGTSVYNATGLIVSTNMGSMEIYWPQDTVFPLTTASQIQATIVGLNKKIQQLQFTLQKDHTTLSDSIDTHIGSLKTAIRHDFDQLQNIDPDGTLVNPDPSQGNFTIADCNGGFLSKLILVPGQRVRFFCGPKLQ